MDINTFIINHKHICYCEALIYEDGSIEYAIPSHIEAMIKCINKTKNELYELIPIDANPLYWISEYTKCIPVWYHGYLLPSKVSEKQRSSLNKLIETKTIEANVFNMIGRGL